MGLSGIFESELYNSSARLHERALILLRHLAKELAVHAADILIIESPGESPKYCEGHGFNDPKFQKSSFHLSLAQQVIAGRQVVFLKDLGKIKNELKHSEDLIAEGFKTYIGVPLVAGVRLVGVLEIFHRDFLKADADWFYRLDELAKTGASALENALAMRILNAQNQQLALAYDQTIEAWARALELRDYEPQGHTQRVTDLTVQFARILGISESTLVHIRRGAMLHDVGKMGIPDEILLKNESLTEGDWVVMRRHPHIAYDQLSAVEFLKPALEIPLYHHEKWDGTGYPEGLAGEKIPLAARIFSLVDVWDSLSSERPYRKAWPQPQVLTYLRDRGGRSFDPRLTDTFVKLLEQGMKRKESLERAAASRNNLEITFEALRV